MVITYLFVDESLLQSDGTVYSAVRRSYTSGAIASDIDSRSSYGLASRYPYTQRTKPNDRSCARGGLPR